MILRKEKFRQFFKITEYPYRTTSFSALSSFSATPRLVRPHGSALVGSDLHERAPGFEVCQMKVTHIGASELTLSKSYEIGLLRIRPLCFWTIE